MRVLIEIAASAAKSTRTIKVTNVATGVPLVPDYAASLSDLPFEPTLADLLGRVQRRSTDRLVELGELLFRALLAPAWPTIQRLAIAQFVRLELRFQPADPHLASLPWEAMHDGAQFLAALAFPRVSVVRRIAATTPPPPNLDAVPLRALFVVACKNDPGVHAGTEFLGLLGRLRERGALVHTRVLLDATAVKLQDAISEFRPGIVHFIGHGVPGALVLGLDGAASPRECRAPALLAALRGSDGTIDLPKVVVLNVCDGASESVDLGNLGNPGACLASHLVAGGVPLVVGMAGRIADDACRLFARRFYESLFTPSAHVDIAEAAAAGRRAASTTFAQGVDWILPRLIADDRLQDFAISIAALEPPDLRANYDTFAFIKRDGFCERTSLIDGQFTAWLTRLKRHAPLNWIFALHSPRTPVDRYGLTWTMKELAARSLFHGFVPIFIDHRAQNDPSLSAFVERVLRGYSETFTRLDAPEPLPPPPASTDDVDQQNDRLAAYARKLLALLAARNLRPILFIDSLQVYEGAVAVLRDLFKPDFGLGSTTLDPATNKRVRTPIVLSMYLKEKQALDEQLNDLLSHAFVHKAELTRFEVPENAYLEHLLHKQLVPGSSEGRKRVMGLLGPRVDGIPSRLPDQQLEFVLKLMAETWSDLARVSDESATGGNV